MNAVAAIARRTTLTRMLVASFCWATATYAFMSASPFVYRQFLAPRVFRWLGTFSDWHAMLYWGWLATVLAILCGPKQTSLARWMTIAGAACGVLAGVYMVIHPLLPSLVDDRRSLIVGVLALTPTLWLAAIDYVEVFAGLGAGAALGPACSARLPPSLKLPRAAEGLAEADQSRAWSFCISGRRDRRLRECSVSISVAQDFSPAPCRRERRRESRSAPKPCSMAPDMTSRSRRRTKVLRYRYLVRGTGPNVETPGAVAQAGSPACRDDGRLFVAAIGTAVFVVVADGVLTPFAMAGHFEPDLLTMGLAAGLFWNLIDHLLIFGGVFLVLGVVEHATAGWRLAARYSCLLALLTLLLSWLVQHTLCNAMGFTGWSSALVAGSSAVSIATTWGALRARRWVREGAHIVSPWDLLFGPPHHDEPVVRKVVPFLALTAAAYAVGAVSRLVDWDFLLLTCGVFALWIATFDQMIRLTLRDVRVGSVTLSAICVTPLALHAIASSASVPVSVSASASVLSSVPVSASQSASIAGMRPSHALDRYAVYNPSFRVADGLLRDASAAGDDSFQKFLRANTGLAGKVEASPADVDFVSPASLTRRPRPPLIFLFVIDSLRRDYLQPYNRDVSFTPNLAAFGAESLVVRHTFTAFGGTGLSVPAIWSGSIGVHKQYVLPFAPMNALEKLLDANGYRQWLSVDSIVGQLIPQTPSMTALDEGRNNEDFTLCGTVDELKRRLEATAADSKPVFAYTLPQDLHVSNIISARVPPGESYPGFHAPYAARVHQIDRCFGDFLQFLKGHGWYDRSLIIVTSDHGEMLGESGLWGHVYYLDPPVVEVPLIVHLPDGVTSVADLDAVSSTTDITPTIYAALGYAPRAVTNLMGRPLVGAPGTSLSPARRASVLAASYSAVYAALGDDGRLLYIVDAVQHREHAYARVGDDGGWNQTPVTDGIREVSRRRIREHLYEINQVYRVKTH